MSGVEIRGGTGKGLGAKVDSQNRLWTRSVTVSAEANSNSLGDAYNINTTEIALTSTAESAIAYVKNNGLREIHVEAVAFGVTSPSSTGGGGTGMGALTVIRNPSTGTIVSGASAVGINSNRNYESAKTLDVNAYKGAQGNTITGGEDHILFYVGTNSRLFAGIDEIIPQGKSVGLKFRPPAGATNIKVYAALICHLEDET